MRRHFGSQYPEYYHNLINYRMIGMGDDSTDPNMAPKPGDQDVPDSGEAASVQIFALLGGKEAGLDMISCMNGAGPCRSARW